MFVFDNAPESIDDAAASPRYFPGQLIIKPSTGEIFRYVQNGGADTTVVAKLATWKTAGTRGVATMTDGSSTDGGLGTVYGVCGVWQKAITTLRWGVLCVVSDYTDVYTDDGVADGDYLVGDGGATHTFIADTAAAGEEHAVFGIARAADNDTTHLVKAAINCLGR